MSNKISLKKEPSYAEVTCELNRVKGELERAQRRRTWREIGESILKVFVVILIIAIIGGGCAAIGYAIYQSEQEKKAEKNFYIDNCSKGDMTACQVLRDHYKRNGN